MSLYEILAIVALAAVGGYAYHLYRSDMRPKPPGSDAGKADVAPGRPMFERVRPDRGDGPGPG